MEGRASKYSAMNIRHHDRSVWRAQLPIRQQHCLMSKKAARSEVGHSKEHHATIDDVQHLIWGELEVKRRQQLTAHCGL